MGLPRRLPSLAEARGVASRRVLRVSRQRESKLSTKILNELRKGGVFCFKVHGSETMMAGLPDIVACVDGLFVGLETKMPESRGNTSPVQKLRHAQIEKAGGSAFVVCSVREALDLVTMIRATRRLDH